MKQAFIAYKSGKISKGEMYRYQTLHGRLFGSDRFVEVGDSPEWREFESLGRKILG
jgi:hypothetical protein